MRAYSPHIVRRIHALIAASLQSDARTGSGFNYSDLRMEEAAVAAARAQQKAALLSERGKWWR